MRIVTTSGYERRVRKLLSPAERSAAELEIVLAPEAWPVVPGTGGARKARVARGSRGKSGGARVIYFAWTNRGVLYFMDIYAKNEKEDVTDAEKKEFRRTIEALQAQA